jgi:ferrochelatase
MTATPEDRTAVLLMAYGTPAAPDEVEAFYTDVRRGRPPTPEQLADLRRRYDAVGGISQLSSKTASQVAGVQSALDRLAPGRFACTYGAKHSDPKIEAAVARLAAAGFGRLVGLVLAPHYSSGSVGEYISRASEAAARLGVEASFVEDWHTDPALIEALAERLRAAFGAVGAAPGEASVELLVTAHSLPIRIIESGDGYDQRLHETGELLAEAVGVSRWRVCWQSAGRTPEPWIGPDVLEVIRMLAAEGDGTRAVVVCPAGFTSDHLEVNYDLDIEARALAESLGLRFARTASLNDDVRICEALARLVLAAAARETD